MASVRFIGAAKRVTQNWPNCLLCEERGSTQQTEEMIRLFISLRRMGTRKLFSWSVLHIYLNFLTFDRRSIDFAKFLLLRV